MSRLSVYDNGVECISSPTAKKKTITALNHVCLQGTPNKAFCACPNTNTFLVCYTHSMWCAVHPSWEYVPFTYCKLGIDQCNIDNYIHTQVLL